MYIHSSCISRILISPYDIQKILSAVDFTWIHGKQFQKIEFFCCQIDFLFSDDHASAFAVNLHLAFYDHFFIFLIFIALADTAHNGFDPCLHFQNIEWLCYVIICSIIQSQDLIHIVAFCCKHNDRNIRIFPDLLTHFKTVIFRKHDIQKNDIICILLCQFQCLFSVISTVHIISILLQTKPDSFYYQFFIIHNQYSSAHVPTPLSDLNLIFYFLKYTVFNTFHFHQIFYLLKLSMLISVTNDRVSLRLSDSG